MRNSPLQDLIHYGSEYFNTQSGFWNLDLEKKLQKSVTRTGANINLLANMQSDFELFTKI